MKKLTIIFLMLSTFTYAQDEDTSSDKGRVIIQSQYSYQMMEPNQNLRKVVLMMDQLKEQGIREKTLIFGTSLIALADYQKSNTDSKFGYLMRHPTANNQIGKHVSEAVIHSFQLSMSGSVTNWLGFYAEMLYNPEQSFGAGTITSLGRNQIQLRKGFVVMGDLNKFPLYGAIGKMDAPFGLMGSVNPFTNSTMWHAFGGLGYGAQIGFKKWNLHATAMAVQGGAQFRAMHMPVADSTNVPSQLNNFVGDLNYTFNLFKGTCQFQLGASYLLGSAYCQEFPVTHFDACNDNNPAYTFYGRLHVSKHLRVMGAFAKTVKVWPGTHNPTEPLNQFEASKVSSLSIGAKYNFNLEKKVLYTVSGEFSNFRAGPDGAPWERQNQIVAGFSAMFLKSSKLFLEIFRTDGYAPLNFISGSAPNEPFPPGVTHSDRNAFSHGIVGGAMLTF